MELENRLYTEEELVNINAENNLTPLEYYTHHEFLKNEYEDYCTENNIPMNDDASAEAFHEFRVNVENNADI